MCTHPPHYQLQPVCWRYVIGLPDARNEHRPLTRIYTALSAFVDVYLAIYPAVVLSRLQLKLRKKIALTVALGIGCV